MRAITGAIVSSEPCTLVEAHDFLMDCCSSPDAYLKTSDCATYILALDDAIVDQYRFLRRCARRVRQHGAADLDAGGYEMQVAEDDDREVQSEEKNRGTVGGPRCSVQKAEVAVAADEKKSKKRKKEEDAGDDKAVAAPASPQVQYEQRKKKKDKHSIVVKQEPGLVPEEELGSEKKKSKKKKDKGHVKLEQDLAELNGQIVSNVVADQGVADGDKKSKKNKHSEVVGGWKSVKQEEKMATDSNLDSDKKKKKNKKRGRGDDDIQEQGEYKKKQRNES